MLNHILVVKNNIPKIDFSFLISLVSRLSTSYYTTMDIINAIKNFEAVRNQYRLYGAVDSEVTEIFEECIAFILDGDDYTIPMTDEEWGLFPNKFNNSIAKILHSSLNIIIILISSSEENKKYIRSYIQ